MKASVIGRAPIEGVAPVVAVPIFNDRVSAGFPSPAQDYVERALDLNELCIRHPAATYFVRVEGESMVDAGIYAGDVLVVDRSLTARHGDIIIAAIDGEYTVKELSTKPLGLIPRNKQYQSIWLSGDHELQTFGVVTNVVRELRR